MYKRNCVLLLSKLAELWFQTFPEQPWNLLLSDSGACPRRRVGGGQTVRHEYEVTPKSAVQGWVMPATVTYEASSEPGSQQACSPVAGSP